MKDDNSLFRLVQIAIRLKSGYVKLELSIVQAVQLTTGGQKSGGLRVQNPEAFDISQLCIVLHLVPYMPESIHHLTMAWFLKDNYKLLPVVYAHQTLK